jgi:hypothetical protein
VPYAQAHCRNLQSLYAKHVARGKDLSQKIRLSQEARSDLVWWLDNLDLVNGKTIFPADADVVIYTDASLTGWGAVLNGVRTRGQWTSIQLDCHINELELWAAFYGLQAFSSNARKITVSMFIDNMTTVCYLNKGGGTRSKRLTDIAFQVVSWCEERQISLQAVHLPGILNSVADEESRARSDASDWRLDPKMFAKINALWPTEVDLFAAAWKHQLGKFVSWARARSMGNE